MPTGDAYVQVRKNAEAELAALTLAQITLVAQNVGDSHKSKFDHADIPSAIGILRGRKRALERFIEERSRKGTK